MKNKNFSRCVIVGGAPISDYPAVRAYLTPNDYFIYCDCGLRHVDGLGHTPDLIIGDFDSHARPETEIETIVLPHKKDDTDTVYAVREALSRNFDSFLLLGSVGARLDHSLANVSLLLWLEELGKDAMLVDDYSEMEIVSSREKLISDAFPYFSLVTIAGPVEGVTIRNALYELQDAAISSEYQYAVSNEPLPGKTASVSVRKGRLLLLRDRSETNL